MIFDDYSHFGLYGSLNSNFSDAFTFLQSNLSMLCCGTHTINENGAHAIISEYETIHCEDKALEFHKKFIDIHIVLLGKEMLGFTCLSSCSIISFDNVKDFGTAFGDLSYITLKPKTFAILFPQDAHKPQIHVGPKSEFVKKVVIKVPHNLDSGTL